MDKSRKRVPSSGGFETTPLSDTSDASSGTEPEVAYEYHGGQQRSTLLYQTTASMLTRKQGDVVNDEAPRVVATTSDGSTSDPSTSRAQATESWFQGADTPSTAGLTTNVSSATFDTPFHLRGLGERCIVCNEATDSWLEFLSHMHLHDPVPSDPSYFEDCALPNGYFQCIICGYQAPFRCRLTEHYIKHATIRPFKCPLCPSELKSCDIFLRHYGGFHGAGGPRYKCDQCDYTAGFSQTLKRHVLKHSGHDGKERCEVCFKRISSSGLRKHYFIHTGERPHACHICGKSFMHKGYLKHHISCTHFGKRERRVCPVCGKSKTPYSLPDHMRQHTDEPTNVCCICGKPFYSPNRYVRHMDRIHVGTKKFPCPVCGKRFFSVVEVQQHMAVHTKEKPYKCEVCGKAFAWKHKIKDHMKTHSEERSFKCDRCGQAFKWKHNLSNHVRAKHM